MDVIDGATLANDRCDRETDDGDTGSSITDIGNDGLANGDIIDCGFGDITILLLLLLLSMSCSDI